MNVRFQYPLDKTRFPVILPEWNRVSPISMLSAKLLQLSRGWPVFSIKLELTIWEHLYLFQIGFPIYEWLGPKATIKPKIE